MSASGLRAGGRAVFEGGWYALLLLLPFSKAAIEILFGVMLLGWVIAYAGPQAWRKSVWSHPEARALWWPLASCLAIGALSISVSAFPEISLRGWIGKHLEYACLFLMAADIARPARSVRRSVVILLVSALFVSLDSLLQLWLGRDPVRWHTIEYYGRMTGPYENPNDLGTYLMVVIPVAISQLAHPHRWWRVAVCCILSLAASCLVLTGAAGAIAGLLVAVIYMGAANRTARRWVLLTVGTSLVLVGGVLGILKDSLRAGIGDRWLMWQAAWRMWGDRPWLGHGVNTFMANYLQYYVGGERQPKYAHNCYLQVAAETGLLGLLAFGWLLVALVTLLVRGAWQAADAQRRHVLLGMGAGLMAFLVQSAVDTNFYALRQAALFWGWSGLAVGSVWAGTLAVSSAPRVTAEVA